MNNLKEFKQYKWMNITEKSVYVTGIRLWITQSLITRARSKSSSPSCK